MRENEPVLLVLSTYDGKLFLRKVKFYGSYTLLVMLAIDISFYIREILTKR